MKQWDCSLWNSGTMHVILESWWWLWCLGIFPAAYHYVIFGMDPSWDWLQFHYFWSAKFSPQLNFCKSFSFEPFIIYLVKFYKWHSRSYFQLFFLPFPQYLETKGFSPSLNRGGKKDVSPLCTWRSFCLLPRRSLLIFCDCLTWRYVLSWWGWT